MKLEHTKRIFSDIESLLQEIKTYFKHIVSDGMQSELYASRIADELGARIENLNGVVQSTLLAYLDKDARQAISGWKPVDQNRYYDKEIRDLVSTSIQESGSFEPPKTLPKKYVKISAGVIAAGGIYRAVSASVFPSGTLIIALATGLFFLLPPVIDKQNKKKILKQLEVYLDEVAERYKAQAQVIIDEYVSHFNDITPKNNKN